MGIVVKKLPRPWTAKSGNEKGKKQFELVKKQLITISVDLKNCLQPNLQHPTIINKRRHIFENNYKKYGFDYVYLKYGKDGWRNKIEKYRKKVICKLKGIIKIMIGRNENRHFNFS